MINYEKLKSVLQKHYGVDMVKSVLIGRYKPSREKMLDMWENESIPLCVWADIKAFRKNKYKLSKEQIQAEQKAWQRLGYSLIKVEEKE